VIFLTELFIKLSLTGLCAEKGESDEAEQHKGGSNYKSHSGYCIDKRALVISGSASRRIRISRIKIGGQASFLLLLEHATFSRLPIYNCVVR
jgi:hypothetical protein